MTTNIQNIMTRTEKFLCVEVIFENDTKTYRAIEVARNKSSLSLINFFSANDLVSLIKKIPKNRPTTLSFTGQGIITKKIGNRANYHSELLFNADLEDFYWYEVPQIDQVYISVIRKKILFDEIEAFESHKIIILDVSVGPFVVSALKPLLPDYSSIFTSNYILEFDGEKFKDFNKHSISDKKPNHYVIGEEKIGLEHIVPFSCLLNYLYPGQAIKADKNFLVPKRKEFQYKKIFNIIGLISLPFFLITLLISYLMLNHFQSEYLKSQVELGEESIAYNKLVVLEADKKNKETILNESGVNNSRFIAFYVSEITKDIPNEISLSELSVSPPVSKIKSKEKIQFANNLIRILGTAVSNTDFSEWIKKIKELDWVENLEIMDFGKDGNANTFEIQIIIRFNV